MSSYGKSNRSDQPLRVEATLSCELYSADNVFPWDAHLTLVASRVAWLLTARGDSDVCPCFTTLAFTKRR